MLSAIADLLNTAGPYAGWAAFALLVTAGLWAYATDRIISPGRHREQGEHYQQRLKQQEQNYEGIIGDLQQRVKAQTADKEFWRDHAVDLMGAVAAQVGRQ